MKKIIKAYFLEWGNPDGDKEEMEKYWNRNYIQLWQLIWGILIFPLYIIVYGLYKFFTIKITFKI